MVVDKYKEKIYIEFEEKADHFTPVSKYPHYNKWLKILNFLKLRGFEIKTPKYYIDNNWGQSSHKIAIKSSNGVAFCLEVSNWKIKVEFGHSKNLWEDGYHFWSLYDDRATQLYYLESKAVENEVNNLLSFLGKYENHDVKLSAEQEIIKKLNENSHIHGKVTCLEDIKKSIESGVGKHNQGYNSKDKNGKQIICGDLKYFYDYSKGKRLSCGIAYHNINNMWWVITPDGDRRNIACFNLFDFNNQPRREQLTKEQKINRLEQELKKYEECKNYIRCISINKQIEKLKASEPIYNVWSLKWNKWWGANRDYYNNGVSTKAVKV